MYARMYVDAISHLKRLLKYTVIVHPTWLVSQLRPATSPLTIQLVYSIHKIVLCCAYLWHSRPLYPPPLYSWLLSSHWLSGWGPLHPLPQTQS